MPIQRNDRENNTLIKADAVPIDWGKTPAKLAQKDTDARWTKKGGQNHYGYIKKLGSVLTLQHFFLFFLKLLHRTAYRHIVYPEMLPDFCHGISAR